jgi:hypothetical protein
MSYSNPMHHTMHPIFAQALAHIAPPPAGLKSPFDAAYKKLLGLGVPVFRNEDHDILGNFAIDGEAGPELDEILADFGLFTAWVHPGILNVYEI